MRKIAELDKEDKKLLNILPSAELADIVDLLLKFKESGESIRCDFNGHILYSDTITMDRAYLKVTKKTKKGFD